MATKTFSGQLDQAIEGAASGNKLLFVPQENLGEVLMGAASEMTVGDDGTYSITLAYNAYSVYHYSNVTKCKTLIADGVEVSESTSVSTIPDLVGVSVPVTDSEVLTNQGYLQEGQDYAASAKDSAEYSGDLFNSFDLRVGQAIEPIETGVPSLDVPFNDSGILKKGVGTEYISGLPVYGVDFTRSTSCYYINKSGLIDFADVDEIAIGKDGAYLHGSVVGNLTYNTQFNTGGGWSFISNLSSETDGTTSPSVTDYDWDAYKLVPSTTTGFPSIRKSLPSGVSGEYTARVVAKEGGYTYLGFTIATESYTNYAVVDLVNLTTKVNFDNGAGEISSDKMSVTRLSDGWVLFTVVVNYSEVTTSSKTVSLVPLEVSNTYQYAGDGTSGVYIAWADISEGNLLGGAPLTISTTSSATTVTATSCTVPVSGNLPTSGESFTIVCDAAVPNGKSVVFGVATVNFILWRYEEDGDIQFRLSDNTTTILTPVSSSTDVGEQRYTISYDDETSAISVYADGALTSTQDVSSIDWSLTPLATGANLLFGGAVQSSYLNSQIKNFKILPYAVSADEVKSWGTPK